MVIFNGLPLFYGLSERKNPKIGDKLRKLLKNTQLSQLIADFLCKKRLCLLHVLLTVLDYYLLLAAYYLLALQVVLGSVVRGYGLGGRDAG